MIWKSGMYPLIISFLNDYLIEVEDRLTHVLKFWWKFLKEEVFLGLWCNYECRRKKSTLSSSGSMLRQRQRQRGSSRQTASRQAFSYHHKNTLLVCQDLHTYIYISYSHPLCFHFHLHKSLLLVPSSHLLFPLIIRHCFRQKTDLIRETTFKPIVAQSPEIRKSNFAVAHWHLPCFSDSFNSITDTFYKYYKIMHFIHSTKLIKKKKEKRFLIYWRENKYLVIAIFLYKINFNWVFCN